MSKLIANIYKNIKVTHCKHTVETLWMPKNVCLNKKPDQPIYYSKKLYHYCTGLIWRLFDKNNIFAFAYIWGEHEYPKVLNEIASAFKRRLSNSQMYGRWEVRKKKKINTTMMFMFQYRFVKHAPIHLI